MGVAPDVEKRRGSVAVAPRAVRFIEFHPIHPIPQRSDGTGGGIRVRGTDGLDNEFFVDVVWGESTRLEIRDV